MGTVYCSFLGALSIWIGTITFSAYPFFSEAEERSGAIGARDGLSKIIEAPLNLFFETPRAQQSLLLLRSNYVQAQGALGTSPLGLHTSITRKSAGNLTNSELNSMGGYAARLSDTLETTISVAPRGLGLFNSLELDLSHSLALSDYQSLPGNATPFGSVKSWELKLSYDVLNGGASDPQNLGNELQRSNLNQSFYLNAKTLVNDYLTYRDLLLDSMANWCKLKNATQDLKVIENTLSAIQVAYRVRSANYKQLLSVIDTRNSIYRNKVYYELQNENFRHVLGGWDEKRGARIFDDITS
jgi:hypothetical protein